MSTPVMQLFDLTGRTALVTGGSRAVSACRSPKPSARQARAWC